MSRFPPRRRRTRLARRNPAGDARRAAERHRRSVQLRPRPPGPDPAVGRRRRPADAAVHRRRGQGLARSRRDVLRRSARHPRSARGDRPLHDARLWREAGRRGVRAGSLLRHHRRHARAGDRRQDDRRGGRGGADPFARLAEFRRRDPARRGQPGVRAARARRDPLAARSRAARRRGDAGDARHLRQFARQSDRLRRHPRGARRGAGDRAPPQPVDRRRRNLRPADLLRRPRAVVPRRHGARRQDPVRPDAVEELGDDRLAASAGSRRRRRCRR